ncbi:extracellular solute-binding protein [Paenibacillus sp. IB182496]|uniref:Extracellular solute-binding protein n=1 Tax=Paenibacillus sabuli TaxID=2772509 RepID=A0A927BU40_9BACL|nr:extracellular solute-binding protein [Paenibacillus sabuli]MBD2845554.1 extracellular solute-binding protein [Paenibacillus sabuli]
MEKQGEMVIWKRILGVGLALALVLSGCSGGGNEGNAGSNAGNTGSGGQAGGPVTITMMNTYHSETAPKDDGAIMQAMEDITQVELDMTWVPNNVYGEKLSVTLASGELPQVILADPLSPSIVTGIESGMFWELDPYLSEFPNLQTFNPIAVENSQYKGKTYGIIRPRAVARGGVVIRGDWMENLDMELPTTDEEVYDLMVAFATQDPDGNGQDDTYGLMSYDGFSRDIMAWFGAPNIWKVEDGRFIRDVETPEYMDGLRFVKRLYDEGLINPNFAIEDRNVSRKGLYTGKVGITVEAFDAVVPFYYSKASEFGGSFDFTVAAPINGRSYGGQGYLSAFLMPKSAVKTEEDLRAILRFFDAQRSSEGTEQFKQLLLDNAAKPEAEQFNIDDLRQFLVNDVLVYPIGDSETDRMIRDRMEANNAVAVGNPAFKYISPTYVERGGELDTILDDAAIQFVLGQIDEDGFQAAVQAWKKAGGSQVAEELAALHEE